ncbi:DUF4238 domain-containing protein [Leptospira sp. WS58.C1]|uniref:DUF4238 domain-containing protein n=1 Tax=Leptospira cinconiae TaxID=3235173 RepID=UPI00349EF60C
MPEYKKAHFVPVSYLKLFSGNQVTFHSYNVDRNVFMANIAVANQCQKDYLYGKEKEIEELLGKQEESFVRLLKAINQDPSKSSILSDDNVFLQIITMLNLQYTRTLDNIRNQSVLKNEFRKIKEKRIKNHDDAISDAPIQLHSLKALMDGIECAVLALDLKLTIIQNDSDTKFITSDAPVIIYNLLFEKYLEKRAFGIASKGLLVFYPISPNVLIMLYDPNIYLLEAGNEIVEKITTDDVEFLNGLQVANCSNNVYFRDESEKLKVGEIVKRFSKNRVIKAKVEEIITPGSTPEKGSSKIKTVLEKPYVDLDLSFLRILENKVKEYIGDFPPENPEEITQTLVRNQELLDYQNKKQKVQLLMSLLKETSLE